MFFVTNENAGDIYDWEALKIRILNILKEWFPFKIIDNSYFELSPHNIDFSKTDKIEVAKIYLD